MANKQVIFAILSGFNNGDYNFDIVSMGMDNEQFHIILKRLETEGLICGLSPIFADDQIYNLNLGSISITQKGIEYLSGMDKFIEDAILDFLFNDNNFGTFPVGKIRRRILIKLRNGEFESYIRNLKERRLVSTFNKGGSIHYYLSDKGKEYVKNGFSSISTASTSGFKEVITEKICEIAENTAVTNQKLDLIGKTLDLTLNAMGSQHQKSIQEYIRSTTLLEQYIGLMKSNVPDKGNRIRDFFSKLTGDVVIGLIAEYSKGLL